MAIDIEKILNISLGEYCKNYHLMNVSNYNLVGVHCHKSDITDFASIVPNEAEAVVNYQHNFFGAGAGHTGNFDIEFQHHQMGVALIPRKHG